jgi:hypothetical protein
LGGSLEENCSQLNFDVSAFYFIEDEGWRSLLGAKLVTIYWRTVQVMLETAGRAKDLAVLRVRSPKEAEENYHPVRFNLIGDPSVPCSTYAQMIGEMTDIINFLRNGEQRIYDFNTPWLASATVFRRTSYLTNVNTSPGAYVHAGARLLALVDSNSFWIAAYFKETQLVSIKPRRTVKMTLMGYEFAGPVQLAHKGHHQQKAPVPGHCTDWRFRTLPPEKVMTPARICIENSEKRRQQVNQASTKSIKHRNPVRGLPRPGQCSAEPFKALGCLF